ncbi:MspA family porin [Nocardia sp. CC201C]|uniref:MspA family porin n=1 Tax=Nocardia sp. CC201C TaxID=3044575 RepID=UPI0024A87908|nr:MspA family porin [Nocardia sp. CC201C]
MTTADGWDITVTKSRENLERWPIALNAAAFSREGFLSVMAVGEIGGQGRSPVRSATIAVGLMIGCNTDVSSGMTLGMAGTLGANLGVLGSGTASQYPSGTLGGNAGLNAGITPSVQVTLRPGSITTVALGSKPLAAATGYLALYDVALRVDSCVGQVALRSVAALTVSTAAADDTITVFGDPLSF